MKIRIAKAFNGYKVGQEFDWGDGMARVMIARGLVTQVDEQQAVERATVDKYVERAVAKPNVRRKGQ